MGGERALDRGEEGVLRGGHLRRADAVGLADGGEPGGGAVVAHGGGAHDRAARRLKFADGGGVEGVDRRDHAAVEGGVELAPFAAGDDRTGGEAHRRQHRADHHRVGGEHLAQERHGRAVAPARGRGLHRTRLDLRARVFQHRAGEHVLGLGMGRDAEARHVDADDPDAVDLGRQKLQRHAGGGRHAEVRHHDGVVLLRVRKLVHRVADVLEELARHQRFGVERHIADRAACAVEVAHEGQPVDAARRTREHGRHPPHPQADAQRAEGRAHALRLVVRTLRVVARELVEHLGVARGARRRLHRRGPGMTAHPVHRLLRSGQGIALHLRQGRFGGAVVADLGHLPDFPDRRRRAASSWARASRSNIVIDHFEGLFRDRVLAAHVGVGRGRQDEVGARRLRREEPQQAVLRQRRGPHRGGERHRIGERAEHRAPLALVRTDDLVVRGFLPQVVVLRNRGQYRDAHGIREGRSLAGAVVLVDDQSRDPDVAAELAEVFHRRADVVRDVERLEVVRRDEDHLLRHVPRDRQAEPAADHVAEEIEEHVIEIPVVEAELLQKLEPVDDPASATAAPDLGAAEFHREDAAALEADVADLHLLARQLLAGRGLDDRGAGLAAEEQRRGVRFWVAADQQHALAHLGHHVAEVGERERLSDPALAIDRDDLGLLRRLAVRHLERRLLVRLVAQAGVERLEVRNVVHAWPFQSRIIFRQPASVKAVR